MTTQANQGAALRHYLIDVWAEGHVDIYPVVEDKLTPQQNSSAWNDLLEKTGVIPREKIEKNVAAVRKFVDGLNRRDAALLREACSPEVAQEWTAVLPGMYASMKEHHIELVNMSADGECVAVKMGTSGYHTGELHGLAATGKWWSNRVFTFFCLADGKIIEVDVLPDVENMIKQLGGVIRPANT